MTTNNDWIPSTEEDFNDFQDEFTDGIIANGATWGVPAGKITEGTNLRTDWDAKYAAGKDESDPTSAQRAAKNNSRKAYTTWMRDVYNSYIRKNASITDEERITLGVPVFDGIRTRVQVPDHAPKGTIKKFDHLFHVLRITDPDKPTSSKKPIGVPRINVYRHLGTSAPAKLTDYTLIGSATKPTFTSSFTEEDVGKKAFYVFQYENTRGERGPTSSPIDGNVV